MAPIERAKDGSHSGTTTNKKTDRRSLKIDKVLPASPYRGCVLCTGAAYWITITCMGSRAESRTSCAIFFKGRIVPATKVCILQKCSSNQLLWEIILFDSSVNVG